MEGETERERADREREGRQTDCKRRISILT
jgi:hypothetical protein